MPTTTDQTEPVRDTQQCPECGCEVERLGDCQALCPACLMSTAMGGLTSDELRPQFGATSPPIVELAGVAPQLEFLELLGGGGSGWVYLARQLSLDRLVAVKLLKHRQRGAENASQRFLSEAKTLARLNHPSIVTVFDYGSPDDEPPESGAMYDFLKMEYLQGPTLRQVLQSGPLSAEQCLRIAAQVCDAMQYAHQNGVVHRDLKPENVLLVSPAARDENPLEVKVADFGIAKLVSATAATAALTVTGTVVGTPHYMAPERWLQHGEATPAGDIYSLGVMLYEMLTGRLPLGAFEPPSTVAAVDSRLSDAVMRALASDPSHRFKTAAEMKSALVLSEERPAELATRRWTPAAAALLSLLAASAFVWAAWRPAETEREIASTSPGKAAPVTPETANQETSAPLVAHQGGGVAYDTRHEPVPPDPTPKSAQESQVRFENVRLLTQRPFDAQIEFELLFPGEEQGFGDDSDGSLYWVLRTTSGESYSGGVPSRNGRNRVLVQEDLDRRQVMRHGSLWPAELYIEERWGDRGNQGRRRVSELFRVQGWHINPIYP